MINFYDLIDLNESISFDEYTKKYIKEITSESFEVSEYLIESGNKNNGSSGLIQKIKIFFSKIKEFIKKWWNKLLKFLGLKDNTDEKESKIDITDKADKETEKSKEEVSKKIEEEIEEIEQTKGETKSELKKIKEEKFKKLVEKYSSRDKQTFDEIKKRLERYIENGLPLDEKIYNYESKKFGNSLGISFSNNNKVDKLFDSDEERVEFYKNSILKKYDEIEFMNLDIIKLYRDIKTTEEYMNDAHKIIHEIYNTLSTNNANTREEIFELLKNIRWALNDGPDEYERQAYSNRHEYYINKASSSNIIYIISYLQEISKIRIVKKSAERENNDLSSYRDTILQYFNQLINKVDPGDNGLINSLNDTLNKFSEFEDMRNRTFMTIMTNFGKIETRISDDAIEAIDDLKDEIKKYPDLSDEEKLNILEEVDMTF